MSTFKWRTLAALGAAMLALATLYACSNSSSSPASVSPMTFKSVSMNGAQVNPSVTTAANGNGFLQVDEGSGALTGAITTFGVTGTSAQLRDGAVGTNGGVVVELTKDGDNGWAVPSGSALTADQVAKLKAGTLYVTVNSTANANGEIRGQVGRQVYFATLTQAQEVPPTGSTATGLGRFVFDPETKTLSGTVTTGVNATLGHIHTGAMGVIGPVTIPFTGGPTNWVQPPTVLTDAQVAALTGGTFYANVHSTAFPVGEIRGQIYLPTKLANLAGAQETPPNTSSGQGTGWLGVNPTNLTIAGRMVWSGVTASTDAHIHNGVPGVAGGIVIRGTVTTGNPGSLVIGPTTAPLADNLFAAFMQGNLYYNVHSTTFPSGEIRGQLVSGQ